MAKLNYKIKGNSPDEWEIVLTTDVADDGKSVYSTLAEAKKELILISQSALESERDMQKAVRKLKPSDIKIEDKNKPQSRF